MARPFFIGVAGGSGSGKTTICRAIDDALGQKARALSSDSYYLSREGLPKAERDRLNFDHPDSIEFDLLADHLSALGRSETIEVPEYCFESHTRKATTTELQPTQVLIVEGILLLSQASVRNACDLKIFVEAEDQTRLQRRIERDRTERARSEESVRQQWRETVAPMYEQFVAPTRAFADITISTDHENEFVMPILLAGIRELVADAD